MSLLAWTTAISHATTVGLAAIGNQQWQQGYGGLQGTAEAEVRIPTGITGVYRTRGDDFGQAVATGDFNGDGYRDLAVGAPNEDAPRDNVDENTPYEKIAPGRGAVSVIYGTPTGLAATAGPGNQLWQHGSPGIQPLNDSAQFGYALASGDFNTDGLDDLAIGIPGNALNRGAVNVIYGHRHGLSQYDPLVHIHHRVFNQDTEGMQGVAEARDRFGEALAAGDFNGDGTDDLAVGAPGEDDGAGAVAVIYGLPNNGLSAWYSPEPRGTNQLWDQNTCTGCASRQNLRGGKEGASDTGAGPDDGDRFGFALAAGDFNADRRDDLAIGVPGERVRRGAIGNISGGATAVVYGSATGLSAWASPGNQLWDQDGSEGANFNLEGGLEGGDEFGFALDAGDFDGSGSDDLAIGVPGEDGDAGAVAVIYGFPGRGLTNGANQLWDQDGCSGCINHRGNLQGGKEAADRFGEALAAGDFNVDGRDDLAIGVPSEGEGHIAASGAVALIYGDTMLLRSDAGPGNQLWEQSSPEIAGDRESGDAFGADLAVGDFNNDGAPDLAVGVPGEHDDDETLPRFFAHAGAVNVLYGTPHPVDGTPPTITPQIAGTLGQNGWYVSDVKIDWAITDAESHVTVGPGCAGQTVTADTSGTQYTCTAMSSGGTTTQTVTIKLDKTPPTVAGRPGVAPNANGWHNQDVSVTVECSDDVSGVSSCPDALTLAREGANQYATFDVVDHAGNQARTAVGPINIDKTPPALRAWRDASTLANARGWNNGDVKLHFQAHDSLSGLARGFLAEGSYLVTTEGIGQSQPFTVQDQAGNTATASVTNINIDKTAPALRVGRVTPANAHGWNNSDVQLYSYARDDLSGLAPGYLAEASYTVTTEGMGQSQPFAVQDQAGNTTTASVTDINIDKTAPLLYPIVSPTPVVLNSNATASPNGRDGNDGSGIDTQSCDAVSTTSLGSHAITCTATDKAGNTVVEPISYEVVPAD